MSTPTININFDSPSPQRQYGQMMPVPVPARPQYQLRTNRGLLKYILLGLITLGIYDIWQMSEISESINIIASKRDGRKTMHYCLMFFIFGWLTLGIGWFVWYHILSNRIGDELESRGINYDFDANTFWIWDVLLGLVFIGPFVYTYKLMKAMNLLSEDYNQRG